MLPELVIRGYRNSMMNMKKILKSVNILHTLVVLIPALLIGGAAGYLFRGYVQEGSRPGVVEIRQGGWNYINPLLECDQANATIEDSELRPFRQKVEDFVTNDLKKKWGDEVSLYFRELNDGLFFEIGREKHFYPASLIKVPMLIAVLKQAEANPGLLKKKVVFDDPRLQSGQNNEVTDRLVLGRSYTVDDLLRRMIQYSDNVSFDLLLAKVVDQRKYDETYTDLGMPPAVVSIKKPVCELSTEQYASCFRFLFNASYLNKKLSEKALEYLTTSDFKLGLVAGLPPNTVVAHKFGFWTENGIRLLHDCGIVYYPNHPYLLCIMTSAADKGVTDPTIGELSHFIYQEIDRQHGNQ